MTEVERLRAELANLYQLYADLLQEHANCRPLALCRCGHLETVHEAVEYRGVGQPRRCLHQYGLGRCACKSFEAAA